MMKTLDTIWMTCLFCAMIIQTHAQDLKAEQQGSVQIKIITEENGIERVIEKTYADMESLKSDPELKELGLDLDLIEPDAKGQPAGAQRMIKVELEKEMDERISENETVTIDDKKHVVVIKKDGEKEEQIIELEGDEAVQWMEENGEILKLDGKDFEFTGEDGKKIKIAVDHLVTGDLVEDEKEIEKNIEIISEMTGDSEIERNVEVEVTEDGNKKIEIIIRKSGPLNIEISEIDAGDPSLNSVPFSINNNLSAKELSYFPNPNDGKFTLKFALSKTQPVAIRIYDVTGRPIFEEIVSEFDGKYSNEIDLKGKERGVYVLQITQKNRGLSRKILIE